MNELINSVLWFSYYPKCDNDDILTKVLTEIQTQDITYSNDIHTRGLSSFRNAVNQELCQEDIGKTHVVPLSSGLDSRAILAALLDHPDIDKSKIHTVSFGSPGTWDFDIGKQVAKEAKVSNTAIDLTDKSFDWSIESLREYATGQDMPRRILDGYVNSKVSSIIDDEFVIWSGFMGDPTAGGHQPKSPRKNWDDACRYFVYQEQYCEELVHPDFDPLSILPDTPFVSYEQLSYEEQLDFALRQQCLIAPIVLGSSHYRTPFLQPSWLEFSLNLSREHRNDRKLFKKIFRISFPDLFSLPTDANSGLSLSAHPVRRVARNKRLGLAKRVYSMVGMEFCHPATNYINFPAAFRRDNQLRDTVYSLLQGFNARDIANWIDPLNIWQEHQNGNDRSKEIRVIISLELYYQNNIVNN